MQETIWILKTADYDRTYNYMLSL